MERDDRINAEERTGYCLCGCGQKTPLSKIDRKERGDKKGFPVRYIRGHNTKVEEWRNRVSEWTSPANYKGGRSKHKGYIIRHRKSFTSDELIILEPMFERRRRGYVLEHRAIVAIREGRTLQSDEFVRHLDGNRSNNSSENLVLGTAKDNFNDHDSARKEVMRLKAENKRLRKIISELHGGKNAKILWEGELE